MRNKTLLFIISLCLLGGPLLRADVAANIKNLTGYHTRMVWSESSGDSRSRYCTDNNNILKGIDTDDGKGIVTICGTRDSYSKPLITPKGDRVVYANFITGKTYVINWDGTGQRAVVSGRCSDVWMDSKTDKEYVIVRASFTEPNSPVKRYCIDDISDSTLLWDKTSVGDDDMIGSWFTVSCDGKHAVDGLPWPDGSFAELPNGEHWVRDGGCWPSLAPDLSYFMWVLNTDHRTSDVYAPDGKYQGLLDLHIAPGIKGWEICHPKWTSDADFVTMTGPYDGGDGGYCESNDCGNNLSAGGTAMNVYIGKLDSTRTQVTGWVQVTNNTVAEFFGDAWIDKGTAVRQAPSILEQPRSTTVFEGDNVILQVKVDGYPYPDYQWRKDGVDIAGAEFSIYRITGAGTGDHGKYTVKVTNAEGTVVSDTADLTVESVAGDNLVLHYGFEDGLCHDLAGSNDGDIFGATPVSDAAMGSGAFSFDGDDYISAGEADVLTDMWPYSYSLWVKPAELGGALVAKNSWVDWFTGRTMFLGADGSVAMKVRRQDEHMISRSIAGAVAAGQWQHLAVSHSGTDTTPRIFLNGTEVSYDSTVIGSGRMPSDGEGMLKFGARMYEGGDYYKGLMDDVRVFNYALTESEIQALYGLTGSTLISPAVSPLPAELVPGGPLSGGELTQWVRSLSLRGITVELYTSAGQECRSPGASPAGTVIYQAMLNGTYRYGTVVVIR